MNSTKPIVSVIIPTYNQADLLQKALQSVINQTFQNWEAIVIDNYSDDNTKEIVESIRDGRINYVLFSNKGIIAASRNHGIHLARGDMIAFLDSDDLWYPSKLLTCLDYITQGADAVCHRLWIRKDGILQNTLTPIPPHQNFYKMLLYKGNSVIATSAVMMKKQCFDRFGVFSEDPGMVTAEDYELWLRLSKSNINWGFISDILGEYTVHSKNASSNVNRQMLAEENVVMKYFKEIDSPHMDERLSYRKRRVMLVFRAGKRVWQSGHRCDSIPYFFKGIANIFL
ncbi:MAG: glycosyltransferase [Methanoregula sp.]|nr:glycosyltransferase [Methanoregula sp.]